jgi:hypothetical protein
MSAFARIRPHGHGCNREQCHHDSKHVAYCPFHSFDIHITFSSNIIFVSPAVTFKNHTWQGTGFARALPK